MKTMLTNECMLDWWLTNRIKYNIIENHYPIGLRNRKTEALYFINPK